MRFLCDVPFPYNFEKGTHYKGKAEFDFEMGSLAPSRIVRSLTTKKLPDEARNDFDSVVLHVHGGGFIAMSSKSHQIYSRVIAKDARYPVFSVDYRLAPEHKYPDALEDCWNVYIWLVKYGRINLGIDASQIILMGDSAGGNLVAALTALAIQNKYQVPHKLILIYPALSLAKSIVYPSLFYSMTDPVLNTSFLKL